MISMQVGNSQKWGFPGGSVVKNPRDPGSISGLGRFPEKEMTVHSGFLAQKIPWTEEPGNYSPWGHKRVKHALANKHKQNS